MSPARGRCRLPCSAGALLGACFSSPSKPALTAGHDAAPVGAHTHGPPPTYQMGAPRPDEAEPCGCLGGAVWCPCPLRPRDWPTPEPVFQMSSRPAASLHDVSPLRSGDFPTPGAPVEQMTCEPRRTLQAPGLPRPPAPFSPSFRRRTRGRSGGFIPPRMAKGARVPDSDPPSWGAYRGSLEERFSVSERDWPRAPSSSRAV